MFRIRDHEAAPPNAPVHATVRTQGEADTTERGGINKKREGVMSGVGNWSTIVDMRWESHGKVQSRALVAQNSTHLVKGITDLLETLLSSCPAKITKRFRDKTESEIPTKAKKFDHTQGVVHNAST